MRELPVPLLNLKGSSHSIDEKTKPFMNEIIAKKEKEEEQDTKSPIKKGPGLFLSLQRGPNGKQGLLVQHRSNASSSSSRATSDESINTPGGSKADEQMSQVLPFLFIGDETIPTSQDAVMLFKAQGITHVVNLATELEEKSPTRTVDDVTFANFPIKDTPDEDLVPTLHAVSEFIDTASRENKNHKIFVHCKAGKSRSASAVIAYLMLKLQMSYDDAFALVKRARPQIDPNIGFVVVLMDLQQLSLN